MMKEAARYTLVEQQLYRRGFASPLLRCLEGDEAEYVMKESRVLLPTLRSDCMNYVKKCNKCQRFAEGHRAPPEHLYSITSPWPFCKWGVDILGPFPMALGQIKFLIVAVDYFTKWVEVEPVATIYAERFGIPAEIVSDNGTQFASRATTEFCEGLRIKQIFTSVEHPQSNSQAEAANRVILKGLRKRLEEAKGRWVEELPQAVIPVEIGESSALRETAHIREYVVKTRVARMYNKRVIPRNFKPQDLVLRKIVQKAENNKLTPSWEGPFRIKEEVGRGAYQLESLGGKKVP
ncbi:Pro-Pol polyprotein, partial [Mucuna pruriens]